MDSIPRDVVHYIITSYFCTREDRRIRTQYHKRIISSYRGRYDGTCKQYGNSNNLLRSINYTDGFIDGLYQSWYMGGQLCANRNYKRGELHGECWQLYTNGQLRESCIYVKGYVTGKKIAWRSDGSIRSIYTVALFGYILYGKHWDINGARLSDTFTRNCYCFFFATNN